MLNQSSYAKVKSFEFSMTIPFVDLLRSANLQTTVRLGIFVPEAPNLLREDGRALGGLRRGRGRPGSDR